MLTAEIAQQSYWTGDVPTAPLVIELDDDGGVLDLAPYVDVEVSLVDPAGVDVGYFPATIVGETVEAIWPDTTALAAAGLYSFVVVLVGLDARAGLAPLQFVVEQVDGWHTLDSARTQWLDAPSDDVMLYTMLDGARAAVVAYAPPITGRVPLPFRQAQLMQARAVWNATKTNDQSEIGADGFAVRVYPLDKNIRQLLRPKRAISGMF